jgi:hypothetical protein
MKLTIETVRLPAHYASPLINGDFSGCSGAEEKEINQWLRDNPHYGGCHSCTEYPELSIFDGILTECLDFDFPVNFTRTSGELEYLIYPAMLHSKPLEWQKRGLQYTATGYGAKIPTDKVLYLNNRMYRVYCRIYSNIGT